MTFLSRRLGIGGDDIIPDSTKESDSAYEYVFSWITNGFQPTKSGQRNELAFSFKFENAEVTKKFQVKFYSREKGSHITWGTEIHKMELVVRGMVCVAKDGATPYQTLAPTTVNLK